MKKTIGVTSLLEELGSEFADETVVRAQTKVRVCMKNSTVKSGGF